MRDAVVSDPPHVLQTRTEHLSDESAQWLSENRAQPCLQNVSDLELGLHRVGFWFCTSVSNHLECRELLARQMSPTHFSHPVAMVLQHVNSSSQFPAITSLTLSMWVQVFPRGKKGKSRKISGAMPGIHC